MTDHRFLTTEENHSADALLALGREQDDAMAIYARADWSLIPEAMRPALRAYIERGKNPGVFLASVVEGDLFAAANIAPAGMGSHIADIARFISASAPGACWGSARAVGTWLMTGGAVGNGLQPAD